MLPSVTSSGPDDELQRALALSAAEARVASMDDDQRLEAAIAESLKQESKSGQAPASDPLASAKRKLDEADHEHGEERTVKSSRSPDVNVDEAFSDLHSGVFTDKNHLEINRLGGSLDVLFVKRWIRKAERLALRRWMLTQLSWARVTYARPSTKQRIVTPRYTCTFGKDDTGAPDSAYRVQPKPFPLPLACLRDTLERKTGARYNAIIINYYADGNDAISYHSDDEAFLGSNPTIASVSLGAARDFYLRRKAPASQDVPAATAQEKMGTKGKGPAASRPMEKMVLEDGDLLVMRGRTQADWEHSIPKRTRAIGGRINMTFRRVVNVSGTNNFIRYNRIGDGQSPCFRWNEKTNRMEPGDGGI